MWNGINRIDWPLNRKRQEPCRKCWRLWSNVQFATRRLSPVLDEPSTQTVSSSCPNPRPGLLVSIILISSSSEILIVFLFPTLFCGCGLASFSISLALPFLRCGEQRSVTISHSLPVERTYLNTLNSKNEIFSEKSSVLNRCREREFGITQLDI